MDGDADSSSQTTPAKDAEDMAALKKITEFHLVPDIVAFPMSTLTQGEALKTVEGHNLFVDRSTPGVIHVFGNPSLPTSAIHWNLHDSLNFGTILQYQEVVGGKVGGGGEGKRSRLPPLLTRTRSPTLSGNPLRH